MGFRLLVLIACLCLSIASFMTTGRLVNIQHRMKVGSPVNFLAVGDWGRKGTFNQSAVAKRMGEVGAKLSVDFVVSTSDNFYKDGLTVLGNRDYHGNTRAQISPSIKKRDPRWNCFRSYSVRSGILHMFFIDTNPFVNKYFAKGKNFNWKGVLPRDRYTSSLLRDLKTNLKRSNAIWKIVIGHHPIRSVGQRGDTKELVQQLLPILMANKVPIYINGHDHCLEHLNSTGSPLEFLTSGGGSRAWANITHLDRHKNNLRFYYDGQGFISVQLTRSEATVVFYDVMGTVLHNFKVKK